MKETVPIVFNNKIYNIPKVLADKWSIKLEEFNNNNPWPTAGTGISVESVSKEE